MHEIGHALGLDHDQKDGFNPYDKKINISETLMSYNSYGYLKDDMFFTALDLRALQEIWGNEISNSNKVNTKKIDKKKINKKDLLKIMIYLKLLIKKPKW